MHRSRAVAYLTLAMLFILLAASAPAQTPGSAGPEAKKDKGSGIIDDEPIIVKPKGGTELTVDKGVAWEYKGQELVAGDAKRFRDDLFVNLDRLEACKTAASKCPAAYAVRFNLGNRILEVRKKLLGYKWDIPSSDKPQACRQAVDCKQGGIPPEFMEGSMRGVIEAKFGKSSDWETVEEAHLILHD